MTIPGLDTKPPLARLDAVRKAYGKVQALDGIDLDVRAGELLTIMRPRRETR